GELIDARNEADQLVYRIEKLLRESGDRLSEADRAPVQAAIARVREAMTRDDVAAIRRAIDDPQVAAQAMAAHLQSQPTPGAQPAGAAAGATGDGRGGPDGQGKDDVSDAEFEVKK